MTRTEIDEKLRELHRATQDKLDALVVQRDRLQGELLELSQDCYFGRKRWSTCFKRMESLALAWVDVKREIEQIHEDYNKQCDLLIEAALDEADEKAQEKSVLECYSANTSSDVQAEEEPA